MQDLRDIAAIWWKELTFEKKCTLVIKNKTHIDGYPFRSPEQLNEREIEIIYTNEQQTNLNPL